MRAQSADDRRYLEAYEADWRTVSHEDARTRGREFLFREEEVCRIVLESGARTAIDVGCADGYLAVLMASRGLAVSILDCVPDAVAHAERLAERRGVSLASTHVGLAEDEDLLERRRWDAVTCTEVIEHVRDPRAVVHRLATLSRRVVVLTTPVGVSYDDPLHIHHWDKADDLIEELDLFNTFASFEVSEIPSKTGDSDRVYLVAGRVR